MHRTEAELRDGAEPSGGSGQQGPDRPETAATAGKADSIPASQGPPSFPPPHGKPAQPARPKANKQSE